MKLYLFMSSLFHRGNPFKTCQELRLILNFGMQSVPSMRVLTESVRSNSFRMQSMRWYEIDVWGGHGTIMQELRLILNFGMQSMRSMRVLTESFESESFHMQSMCWFFINYWDGCVIMILFVFSLHTTTYLGPLLLEYGHLYRFWFPIFGIWTPLVNYGVFYSIWTPLPIY